MACNGDREIGEIKVKKATGKLQGETQHSSAWRNVEGRWTSGSRVDDEICRMVWRAGQLATYSILSKTSPGFSRSL